MYRISLLLFFLFPVSLFAQNSPYKSIPIDSLKTIWEKFVNERMVEEAVASSSILLERSEIEYNDSTQVRLLLDMGDFYLRVRMLGESVTCAQKAFALSKNRFGENHTISLTCLVNMATCYDVMGKTEEGLEVLDRCLTILNTIHYEDSAVAGGVYNAFGEFHRHRGGYQKAIEWQTKALASRAKHYGKMSGEYGASLNNLAGAYYGMGQFEEVLALMLESKAIKEKTIGTEHPKYASTLNNIALVNMRLARYQEALDLYKEAKTIREKTTGKMHPDYAGLVTNMGNAYQSLGQMEKALPYLKESAEIRRVVQPNHPKLALSLSNLGTLYVRLKLYHAAEKCFLEVEQIYIHNKSQTHPDYALLLSSMATVYEELGQIEKAKELHEESIYLLRNQFGNKHHLVAQVLSSYSTFYAHQSEWEKTIDLAEQALLANCINIDSIRSESEFFKALESGDFYSNVNLFRPFLTMMLTLSERFKSLKEPRDIERALEIGQTALRLINRMSHEMSNAQDKLFLLQNNINIVNHCLESYQILRVLNPAQDAVFMNEMLQLMEKNKSILLSDAVKADKGIVFGNLPDSLYQQELALEDEFDYVSRQVLESVSPEELAAARSSLNRTHQKISAFKEKLKTEHPNYFGAKYASQQIDMEEVQADLDEKTLIVEYFIADSAIHVLAIGKSGSEHLKLKIKKNALEKQVKILRNSLSNYAFITKEPGKAYNDFVISAYWFYEQLVEPILKGKSVDDLMIVADGELGHLPFEVFLTEKMSSNVKTYNYNDLPYLVKQYKIHYNYSTNLWKENKQKRASSNNGQMLAIAASYREKGDSTKQNGVVRSPSLEKLRSSLIELPAAISEVEALGEEFSGKFVTGEEATEGFFKGAQDNYTVIHLAMHGILNAKSPLLSGLVFTEDRDSLQNNFLQAYEISNMKLNTDLVVLSACETGFGKFEQGEGVMSLARSFMYAGVPSMLVSLWQVNDLSTAIIMKAYYENLSKGKSKSEALQAAKIYYLNGAKDIAAHPAFWSAFIQLGNNDAIHIESKSNWLPWGVGGLVVLLLGFFVVKRKKT